MVNRKRLATIDTARKLHGHLGPFLVIGVRMGEIAIKTLKLTDEERHGLLTNVKVPLHPPFSCLLDGIQVSTTCTIGNQRLKIKNSKTVQATFRSEKDIKTVKIALTEHFSWQIEQKQKGDELNETFAWEVAELPENQLFKIVLR